MATTHSIDESPAPQPIARADRSEWLLLAGAILGSAALALWFGRDTTFSVDELTWVLDAPGFSIRDAIEPYNGHLVLTSRLVYAAFFEVFGSDYLPFRLLTTVSVALTATLFFIYSRPRIGRLAALAPTLILLVFGSDALHVLHGNGFTILFAVACGLGALIMLPRGGRGGGVAACALLCVGVLTYTVALAFVSGVAVMVLSRADRWRRIWIVLVPAGLYATWWLWSLQSDSSSESLVTLSNLLVLPSWAFQSLSEVISALTGLDYDFGNGEPGSLGGAGATLALVAITVLCWRLWRRRPRWGLWSGVAVFIALAAMNVLVAGPFRSPDAPRYLFPGAYAVLLIAVEAAAGIRWRRAGLLAVYTVAAIGAAANVALLRDASSTFRVDAEIQRAELAAIEIAGPRAPASLEPGSVDPESPLVLPWGTHIIDQPPTQAYLAAAEEFEPFGFSLTELRGQTEAVRARADAFLAGVLGLLLAPSASEAAKRCPETGAGPDGAIQAALDPGQTAVLKADVPGAQVRVRRFATVTEHPIGELQPGQTATLTAPADGAPDPWHVSISTPSVRICEGR